MVEPASRRFGTVQTGETPVPPYRFDTPCRCHGMAEANRDAVENGGTGVSPVRDERITCRNLPHWQLRGGTYFLTWRCSATVALTEIERDFALSAIRYWDGTRWKVFAAVVMPDHIHVLVRPLSKGDGDWDLAELLHSVKSYSAHRIAKARRNQSDTGPTSMSIWQDERYDRWIRDIDEFAEKWQYIADNPVKAGLVRCSSDYRWLYLIEESPDC